MAHFAVLDESNIVTQVLVVSDDVITDENGVEQEQLGIDFLTGLLGVGTYKKTSYNENIFLSNQYIMNRVFDLSELVKRLIKYLVEGLMVALAAYAIPKRSLDLEEFGMIALAAAATFSILDTYIPTIGATARSGAGFGIGANLVGFPGGL